jgi:hypothetical protein
MTPRQVRARLLALDHTYSSWAKAHGYETRTVTQAVNRWANRAELPRGRLTYRILKDLSRTIGQEILPGILDNEL